MNDNRPRPMPERYVMSTAMRRPDDPGDKLAAIILDRQEKRSFIVLGDVDQQQAVCDAMNIRAAALDSVGLPG